MKDETGGDPIVEFIGLKPKMYSYTTLSTRNGVAQLNEKHRAKGIQAVASVRLRHNDYLAQLNNPTENYQINRRIGAIFHKIYSIETKKRGLCAFDDKRYLLPDGVHSLAFGHQAIPHPVEDIRAEKIGDVVLTDEEAIMTGAAEGLDVVRLFPAYQPGRDPHQLEEERQAVVRHIRQVRARHQLAPIEDRHLSISSDELNDDVRIDRRQPRVALND